MYGLTNGPAVIRYADGASIPSDPEPPPPTLRERIVARPQADPVALAQAERITIRAAAQASAELADWLDLLRAAQEALPTDSRTQAGMAALAVAGPLTENRKTEILG